MCTVMNRMHLAIMQNCPCRLIVTGSKDAAFCYTNDNCIIRLCQVVYFTNYFCQNICLKVDEELHRIPIIVTLRIKMVIMLGRIKHVNTGINSSNKDIYGKGLYIWLSIPPF